ncbi:hypothetical protein QFZ48_003042 [Chitinophaga sp. W2I13]|uniref:hypothetical protein n=1 Tax=Chitinophaga sp. W2I13 TaxID=3373923 RepID=UPI003D1C6ECC
MNKQQTKKEWITTPILPCTSIEETLAFWEELGYRITYKLTRPYQYGILERGGYELHFARVKGMDAAVNYYGGCLVAVTDARAVYLEFTKKLKASLGRVPNTGIPRISRMKPDATRFTLTDVSGNSIIFVSFGEKDEEVWQNADNKDQSPLQKSIAVATRFRDYKNDDMAAAKTLDVALARPGNEANTDIAEALMIRIELAGSLNEPNRTAACRSQLEAIPLSKEELSALKLKHAVDVP